MYFANWRGTCSVLGTCWVQVQGICHKVWLMDYTLSGILKGAQGYKCPLHIFHVHDVCTCHEHVAYTSWLFRPTSTCVLSDFYIHLFKLLKSRLCFTSNYDLKNYCIIRYYTPLWILALLIISLLVSFILFSARAS